MSGCAMKIRLSRQAPRQVAKQAGKSYAVFLEVSLRAAVDVGHESVRSPSARGHESWVFFLMTHD